MKMLDVLLVEDSPSDVLMTRKAFQQADFPVQLHVVRNGVDAMAFLRREPGREDAPRPDIVLLDLNLPRMDGREVLAAIKGDEALRSIPVVVLTTSSSEEDVVKAYGLHANCYLAKPVSFERFLDVVRSIESFWFSVVTLPSR